MAKILHPTLCFNHWEHVEWFYFSCMFLNDTHTKQWILVYITVRWSQIWILFFFSVKKELPQKKELRLVICLQIAFGINCLILVINAKFRKWLFYCLVLLSLLTGVWLVAYQIALCRNHRFSLVRTLTLAVGSYS